MAVCNVGCRAVTYAAPAAGRPASGPHPDGLRIVPDSGKKEKAGRDQPFDVGVTVEAVQTVRNLYRLAT
jgi:hypothetical protein